MHKKFGAKKMSPTCQERIHKHTHARTQTFNAQIITLISVICDQLWALMVYGAYSLNANRILQWKFSDVYFGGFKHLNQQQAITNGNYAKWSLENTMKMNDVRREYTKRTIAMAIAMAIAIARGKRQEARNEKGFEKKQMKWRQKNVWNAWKQ